MFVLPRRFGGTGPGFVPSGSLKVHITERGPTHSSFLHRFRVLFLHNMVWIHALFIFSCVLGVVLNIVRCFDPTAQIRSAYGAVVTTSGRSQWVFLLTRIGWPPVFWLSQVISCWIPIEYILWPPPSVTADEALQLDEKTGVRYPKAEYWGPKRQSIRGRLSDHFSTVIFVYTLVCLAASWFVRVV